MSLWKVESQKRVFVLRLGSPRPATGQTLPETTLNASMEDAHRGNWSFWSGGGAVHCVAVGGVPVQLLGGKAVKRADAGTLCSEERGPESAAIGAQKKARPGGYNHSPL